MKILLSILILTLSGCSSFESRTSDMYKVDATYCNGSGFKAYSEIGDRAAFVCKTGERFMVRI